MPPLARLAPTTPHRLGILLSLVLVLLIAVPEAVLAKHRGRPVIRNSVAKFLAQDFPDDPPAGTVPPPTFTCVWKEDAPVHDYHCSADGRDPPQFRLTEQPPPDTEPPPPQDPIPHALTESAQYDWNNDGDPDSEIEGWDGYPPLAHPDSAPMFTCMGDGSVDATKYQCSFTFFGHAHTFTVAEIVSVSYAGGSGTEQWFVPCDLPPAPCLEVPPPPPDTSITEGPSGSVRATAATFGFASSRSGSSFECRLDGGSWRGCSTPSRYADLADGRHLFEVRAGNDGNFDSTPADRGWRVDTAGPLMRLAARAVRLSRRGVARLRVRCLAGEQGDPCSGRLTLRSARAVSAGRRRRIKLGSRRFQIAAGGAGVVRVKLSRRHRRLVGSRGRLRVRATVEARDQLGNLTVLSKRFPLLAPRR
jgi:hypothetical protein